MNSCDFLKMRIRSSTSSTLSSVKYIGGGVEVVGVPAVDMDNIAVTGRKRYVYVINFGM